MPNVSDYDENGNLLNPEYWDGPPDLRTMDEKIDDFFAGKSRGLIMFDLYKDWLFYPPRIETKEEAEVLITERICNEINRVMRAFPDEPISKVNASIAKAMNKYDVANRVRSLTYRFCEEMHDGKWTRYKERDKILKELGKYQKPEVKQRRYLVEFQYDKTYRFQADSQLNIDELFDYYRKDSGHGYVTDISKLKPTIEKGIARVYETGKIVNPEKSLYIMEVDENNHILQSRLF